MIVIGSFLGLLMLWTVGSTYGSIATVIRVFRIGRVLRLVRGLESMAQLFNTLLLTLPSLGNVGALLCLLFFIYAAMGVQLFAKVTRRRKRSREAARAGLLLQESGYSFVYGIYSNGQAIAGTEVGIVG